MRVLILTGAALLLAGCASTGPVSIKGGECRIFERPEYAVLGKKPYDQDWIDSQIEGGVGGCRWKRPAPRPAAIDGAADVRPAPVPIKRPGLVRRFKDRIVWPKPKPVPSGVPSADPQPAAQLEPAPTPPPRNRVDELLRPTEPRAVYPK